MKKHDLGRIIQILANVGVIAGIVLLGLELQQNNSLLGAQARADQRDARKSSSLLLLQDTDIGDLYYRSSTGETLSDGERFIFNQYIIVTFIDWEWQYGEYRAGMLDSLPTAAWRGILERQPYFRELWDRRYAAGSAAETVPGFVDFVNGSVLAE